MHTQPCPLYQQYQLNKRLGDLRGRYGRFGEKYLFITEIQTPDRRVCSVVTTPTELPRVNIREFLKVKTLFSLLVYSSTLQTAHRTSVTASNSRMGYEFGGCVERSCRGAIRGKVTRESDYFLSHDSAVLSLSMNAVQK